MTEQDVVSSLFQEAVREDAKLRLGICGSSGSGKTYSALLIAKGMVESLGVPDNKCRIAMIDTESKRGKLYANTKGVPKYFHADFQPPYSPDRYIQYLAEAEKIADVIIIDSLTHAWTGTGGILDIHSQITQSSKSKNSYTAWRNVSPKHNQLVDSLIQSKAHIIATVRAKTEYAMVEGSNGQPSRVEKLGLAPVQRDGMEYEFTLFLDINQSHIATVSKGFAGLFTQHEYGFTPSESTGKELIDWLLVSDPDARSTAPPANTNPDSEYVPSVDELIDSINASVDSAESYEELKAIYNSQCKPLMDDANTSAEHKEFITKIISAAKTRLGVN